MRALSGGREMEFGVGEDLTRDRHEFDITRISRNERMLIYIIKSKDYILFQVSNLVA